MTWANEMKGKKNKTKRERSGDQVLIKWNQAL